MNRYEQTLIDSSNLPMSSENSSTICGIGDTLRTTGKFNILRSKTFQI